MFKAFDILHIKECNMLRYIIKIILIVLIVFLIPVGIFYIMPIISHADYSKFTKIKTADFTNYPVFQPYENGILANGDVAEFKFYRQEEYEGENGYFYSKCKYDGQAELLSDGKRNRYLRIGKKVFHIVASNQSVDKDKCDISNLESQAYVYLLNTYSAMYIESVKNFKDNASLMDSIKRNMEYSDRFPKEFMESGMDISGRISPNIDNSICVSITKNLVEGKPASINADIINDKGFTIKHYGDYRKVLEKWQSEGCKILKPGAGGLVVDLNFLWGFFKWYTGID